jgi:hypothetical protein
MLQNVRKFLPGRRPHVTHCASVSGGGPEPRFSFVDVAILGILFAIMKAPQDRRSPWYQRGLICEALRKVSVILLHDVEDRFLGELSMVLGK